MGLSILRIWYTIDKGLSFVWIWYTVDKGLSNLWIWHTDDKGLSILCIWYTFIKCTVIFENWYSQFRGYLIFKIMLDDSKSVKNPIIKEGFSLIQKFQQKREKAMKLHLKLKIKGNQNSKIASEDLRSESGY